MIVTVSRFPSSDVSASQELIDMLRSPGWSPPGGYVSALSGLGCPTSTLKIAGGLAIAHRGLERRALILFPLKAHPSVPQPKDPARQPRA